MAIRWVSNPESIKADQPSVLAIAETLAAMGVSVWIAVKWQTYIHIAIGASIAPLLLMRTDESCVRGAGIAEKIAYSPVMLLLMVPMLLVLPGVDPQQIPETFLLA